MQAVICLVVCNEGSSVDGSALAVRFCRGPPARLLLAAASVRLPLWLFLRWRGVRMCGWMPDGLVAAKIGAVLRVWFACYSVSPISRGYGCVVLLLVVLLVLLSCNGAGGVSFI